MAQSSKGDAFQGEQRLYQIVARRLARMIEENRHDPNWRLAGERDLAEMLEVSRPVVREAIIALEVQGIVAVRGRSGVTILPPREKPANAAVSDADLFDLLETRRLLEPGIARLAAERAGRFDFSILTDLIGRMSSGSTASYVDASTRFFGVVAQVPGNPVLRSTADTLLKDWSTSPFLAHFGDMLFSPERRPTFIGDHYGILSALSMRQPEAAARAVFRHFDNLASELTQLVDEDRADPTGGEDAGGEQGRSAMTRSTEH